MRKTMKSAAAVAVGLFLVTGSASAGRAGAQFPSPGYDGASIASKVDKRVDPRLEHVSDSASASGERLMGKAGVSQRLNAF